MESQIEENSVTRASRLRFNFGFLIEASSGASREIEIDYPSIWLADDLELSPLAGTFEAIRNSKGIYITGRLFTNYAVECAKCLDPVKLAIVFQLDDLFYYPAHTAPPGDFGVGEDGFIDLSPLVRELCLLEIPMQPICRDDCQGLCSQCGSNLNHSSCDCEEEVIDPRLSALQELLDDKNDNQR
jgi:uncharacterized protein